MPSSALLFVPLLAGFIFLRLLHWTRYISRSWESTRLVFSVGIAGLCITVAARAVIWVLRPTACGAVLLDLAYSLFPTPYAVTMAATLILALGVPLLVNLYIDKDEAVRRTKKSGTRLHEFLVDQTGEFRAVALTLADQKVYIGLVQEAPNLDPCEKYVVIAPQLSGYRDEQRRLNLTTNYGPAREKLLGAGYDGWTENHLKVLVALDQIVSAHLYNPKLHSEAFPHKSEVEQREPEPTAPADADLSE